MSNDKPFSIVEFVTHVILWLVVFFLLGRILNLGKFVIAKLFTVGTGTIRKIATR